MSEQVWVSDLGNGYYKNPVLYADYSDPDAIRVGEDYFMVASSFSNSPALPLLHSKDLVNWKVVNYIAAQIPEQRYDAPVHGCGVWAPSIRYHEGVYYVCFPMPDEGIYMSTAKDPFGTWSKPMNIRPGAGWIDPCPFWDEDGNAYLVAGVAKSRIGYKSVLHMVQMLPDGTGVYGQEVKIFDGNENDQVTIEGPKMYKKDGYYYIFAPAGGVKPGWQTVLRSKNVWGPYEYKVVMRQGSTDINGPHQGAWVDTVTGEDWFIHFQDVYAAGRLTLLEPMSWKDGWPIIGIAKDGNDYGEPVREYKKPDVGKVYEIEVPETSDDFASEKLGLQWQWNANYKDDWYAIDPVKQQLHLNAIHFTGVTEVSELPNLLLQKWPAPEFICETKLDLSKLTKGDIAGVISMGIEFAALTIHAKEQGFTLNKVIGHQEFENQQVHASQLESVLGTFHEKEIFIRYIVKQTGYRENAEFEKAPQEEVTLQYSFDGSQYKNGLTYPAQAGRWVGVKNGVFCTSNHESNGQLLVDYVYYSK